MVYFLFNGFGHVFQQGSKVWTHKGNCMLPTKAVALVLPGFGLWCCLLLPFWCLPRQFHVAVVENHNITHTKNGFLAVSFVFVFNFFICFPIAIAGKMLLSANIEPDTYVLSLPLWADAPGWHCWFILEALVLLPLWLWSLSFALSIMVSNNCSCHCWWGRAL